METERLYEQDSHLVWWEATVLACETIIDGYRVVLDRTALPFNISIGSSEPSFI